MRILLTNDDGLEAEGLAALGRAAEQLGMVTTVAPTTVLSGCSHRVTTDQPFGVFERGPSRYAVEGTPADCVRVALERLAPDVDWVLSGINHGGNLGADVHHSGTVAAVREGVFHGKPGIALSHFRRTKSLQFNWDRAVQWIGPLLQDLMAQPWQPATFWNINLPDLEPGASVPEIVFCPVDLSPLPLGFTREGTSWRYAGNYQQRQRRAGHDVETCFGGKIAVSLMSLV